jgi:1-acyl-sn-glycerol-3-phosphate acyltransferase
MMQALLASAVRFATGVRIPAVEGWTGEPCIFFANHSSHLDALVIWASLPTEIREHVSPVAARDYWEKTNLRRWLATKVFHAVLLERHGRSADRSHPMEPVEKSLRSGRSVIIFPEGTRSQDGRMKPFKAGIHHLRLRFRAKRLYTPS